MRCQMFESVSASGRSVALKQPSTEADREHAMGHLLRDSDAMTITIGCPDTIDGREGRQVLDDVASVVGAEVTLLSRLPGGVNAGAMRVQLAGRANAVLKAVPRAHPNHLDETLRAQRVVEHMRRRGYPTPAWLGVGATATHVWHLMDFVDAAPAPELTPSLVEQLMEIIELQSGLASEPDDHWSYAWRVATGQESAVAGLRLSALGVFLRGVGLGRAPAARVCRRPTTTRGT